MSNPDDIQLTEGDEAERLALDMERRAKRAQGESPEQELARKMRELGAADVTAGGDDDTAQGVDVLDGLVERAKGDPAVVFLPSVLDALLSLREDEAYAFQLLWNRIKSETAVPMTELRGRLTELERSAKRAAKKQAKEREAEERRAEVERRRAAREGGREARREAADETWKKHFYTSDDGRLEMRPGEIITVDRREREETVAHYSARIATEVRRDTGMRVERRYEMEVITGRSARRFEIPADEFGAMKWVAHVGADVVTAAGPKARDLARECIQLASRPVSVREEFCFTGWRVVDGKNAYLHAGGVVGGARVEVRFPSGSERLSNFSFPKPLEGDDLRRGIEQCLEVMFSLPDFTGPLCAAAWRAVLGNNRNVLFVHGGQSNGKTTAVCWAQNHFSTEFSTASPPLTWESTAFGIRAALATIGDAPLLIDDYRQLQDPHQDRTFASVVRSVSDGTARSKGTVDSTVVQDPLPRALLIATAETPPKIDSLNSRMIVLPLLGPLPLERETVARFDQWALEGRFAGTMAAYVAWLAEGDRLSKVRARFAERAVEFATELQTITREGRSAKAVASVWAGVLPFLWWAHEAVGAIDKDARDQAVAAIGDVFRELARNQVALQSSNDTSARFVEYLSDAIASGQAYLTDDRGMSPEHPSFWGWQIADSTQDGRVRTTAHGTEPVEPTWRTSGRKIGYVKGAYAYVLRTAALGLVQRVAAELKESFAVDAKGLTEQLHRRGLLVKVEGEPGNPRSRTVRGYEAPAPGAKAKVQKFGYLCFRAELLSAGAPHRPTPTDAPSEGEGDPWETPA